MERKQTGLETNFNFNSDIVISSILNRLLQDTIVPEIAYVVAFFLLQVQQLHCHGSISRASYVVIWCTTWREVNIHVEKPCKLHSIPHMSEIHYTATAGL